MGRFARVVALDVAHHVTQRGNARQFILDSEVDREVYLGLLRDNTAKHSAQILGYCVMSNHVHLVAVPRRPESLAMALKHTHGRYAAYWNAKRGSSGHVWQGRFYSCPLGQDHLWRALRYAELNPVRARLVTAAENWAWSSARVHCGSADDGWLDLQQWNQRWNSAAWRDYLRAGENEAELTTLRQATHSGRPLGSKDFVHDLEQKTERLLTARKGGRPAKLVEDSRQGELVF